MRDLGRWRDFGVAHEVFSVDLDELEALGCQRQRRLYVTRPVAFCLCLSLVIRFPLRARTIKNEPVKLREWDLNEAAENPLKLPSHLSAGLWVAMHDYSRLLLDPYRAASH